MSYEKEVKLIQGDAGAQIKFHLFRSIYLQLDISFHPCSHHFKGVSLHIIACNSSRSVNVLAGKDVRNMLQCISKLGYPVLREILHMKFVDVSRL